MGLSIKGYVLEPVRVGSSNSPYTFTPNDVIAQQGTFDGYYTPGSEGVSRTDYCVVVQVEGLLVDAAFGFTKNEGTTTASVRRFDYDAQAGHFKPLPGSSPDLVGTLSSDANTTRLKVIPPIGVLAAAPFRLSVGSGSGLTFTVALVPSESGFGAPSPGTVELARDKGTLNWNSADLTTYAGQAVSFQRQSFFEFTASTGRVGLVGDAFLLLNPLPGSGQYPRIRIGFGFYLTPVEVANEASFSPNPASGTVEWARDTGRLKLNSADVTTYTAKPLYYDGVLFSWKQSLPSLSAGLVNAPASIPVPLAGGDLIFRLPSGYQFPTVRRVTMFDAGSTGEVQLRVSDGSVQFSAADIATYGATAVQVFYADLPIERGISVRFFRSPVNLDGSDPTIKDVTAIYTVTGAIWASPIIQSPFIFPPATPIQDPSYPLTVTVEQGTGSYTGVLPDLDVPVPSVGLGYFIDYENKQLLFGQRKVNQIVTTEQSTGVITLPDVGVRPEHLSLELEVGAGTGNFAPLTLGKTALFDQNTGLVTLMTPKGLVLASGTNATFSGLTLTDAGVDFLAAGVSPGHQLIVPSGVAEGVYTVVSRTTTTLTTDNPAPSPATAVGYEVTLTGEVVADRYFSEAVPVDPNTKVERIRSIGTIQNEQIVMNSGIAATFSTLTLFTDVTADFLASGVVAGDTVKLTAGSDAGSYRTIVTVQDATNLVVDRPLIAGSESTYLIARRLHIPKTYLSVSRVRIGLTFATIVSRATNAAFTAPALLPSGTVEISSETGDINFSQTDVATGATVYWGLTLRYPRDFKVSKDLGFVDLSERLLTGDEMYVSYKPVTSAGVQPLVTEHVGFLIRKESTEPFPRPQVTNTVFFNPAGRTVSTDLAPSVFRGGRPQDTTQIVIDSATSKITFLPNVGFMTDALPSGDSVQEDERILVDYYVYQAVGGERSFNVLQPPIFAAQVLIATGSKTLTLNGDQTALFPSGYLLRVETQQVYLIGTSVYDSGSDQTTITLAYNQEFQDDFTNPKLYVTSGPIRVAPSFMLPSYFVTEMYNFGSVPRGMNVFTLPGDRTLSYAKGTVVLFSDNATYNDMYLVSGASYKDSVTTVTLQQNVRQQYRVGQAVLRRSQRAILDDGVTQAALLSIPVAGQPIKVLRRVEGSIGRVLQTPDDYTLDQSGILKYSQPLQPREEIQVCYMSYRIVPGGTRLRSSYITNVVPDETNGLLGQTLKVDYSLFQGDSFYFRVETLTNFSGEIQAALQAAAQASTPSSGPLTSNSSSPTLYQQGRESLFFTEGHVANVDYVSRLYLKFFNDNINYLEDVLQNVDGRVIGDVDGRFKFDGKIDNAPRATYASVTNEIDDQLKISDFPIEIASVFPLSYTFVGTYQKLYQTSVWSRLYPTQKDHLSAITTAGQDTGALTATTIGDFGVKSMTTLPNTVYRRLPRGRIQNPAKAGDTLLFVDNATGSATFLRPPFATGMFVVIKDRDGTDIVSDATPLTVVSASSSPERIQISPLPVDVPEGATVFLCTTGATPDTVYALSYRQGFDLLVSTTSGELVFVAPYPPFDGSDPSVPAPLQVRPPNSGEILEMDGVGILQLAPAPFKFPALYGELASDCGDQSIPVLSPTTEQEPSANISEGQYISLVASEVSVESESLVTLDVTGTILTNVSPWSSPVPQPYDLVCFTTGANVSAGYRRILSVGVNTVTVDAAFPTPSVSANAIITAATDVSTGSATFPSALILDDATLSSSIKVGHTVILTSGANAGVRRQVQQILSPTQVLLDHAVPFLVATNYRVSNHLRTFSGWTEVLARAAQQVRVTFSNDHNVNPSVVDSVVLAITRFLEGDVISETDGVLTDILSPTSNPGAVLGSTLTDPGQDFSSVVTTDFVYIETGSNQGFYPIQSVDSTTSLTVTTPFAVAGVVTYRIVKAFGVGGKALSALFRVRLGAALWKDETLAWTSLLNGTASVIVSPGVLDTNIYANEISFTDLINRVTALATRYTDLTDTVSGPVPLVEAIVKSQDKLYDKRYAWIDARTNLLTGSLFLIERAVVDRLAATAKLYNDLLKLLSVA